ncbi:MAG: RNA-binding protein [Gammaproteobacteria bacterium]|nr:RNA-binding protein [Gammaproteobacteria bacterium]MBU1653522.1 RNA-binding protein [Gammaproteobacteria bacterium]MBU1962551.1 RNA-binding protein [Gammaproteobacteria bacterium]
MLIQILNLPRGVSSDDIADLFGHLSIIDDIRVIDCCDREADYAWVRLHCGRAAVNALAEAIDGRYYRGRRLDCYAPLFASA